MKTESQHNMSRGSKELKLIEEDAVDENDSSSEKTIKMEPILSSELTEEISLDNYYIGIIKEKRNISKTIKLISSILPGFGHLKRCNNNRIILSKVSSYESIKQLKELLTMKEFDLRMLEDNFQVLKIPSKQCKTKLQADRSSKIWPLNFHPDPTIELILSGNLFERKVLLKIELFMKITIEASRIESIGNSECNGSALVVDPINGEPLAIASSQLNKHPLFHASMLAIDLIAKIQGGGSWDLMIEEKEEEIKSVKTQKRKSESNLPLRYPNSLNKINFPNSFEPLERETNSSRLTKLKMEQAQSSSSLSIKKDNKTGPYLCTNYWIFLLQEPCTLCSMALLHSRAAKIFYGIKNSNGVLGSKALLHTTQGLNHRYQVWSGLLENECKIVSDYIKEHELK